MKKRSASTIRPLSGGVTAAQGFCAGGVRGGIKSSGDLDIGVVYSERACAAAGAFTTNKVRASSVEWCSRLVPSDSVHAIFCNSGNANACTGKRGEADTRAIARMTAQLLHVKPRSVLVGSTGIIGHPLPMDKIAAAAPKAVASLSARNGGLFTRAIMTTDTKAKESAVAVTTSRGGYVIGGCAKGSGMICPTMATMLSFVTSDAAIPAAVLDRVAKRVVERTFNNLTVDGDMSTNDTVLVLANGASGVAVSSSGDITLFEEALFTVCNTLCAKIAEDGEGATKRIEVNVGGGATYRDAQLAAKAIANSNLVKTAMFGNDPNWGRILCAIGYSGAAFSHQKLLVKLCGMTVCKGTTPVAFPIKKMQTALRRTAIAIDVDLGMGKSIAVAHTCDLTYDYIKINAEYHT